MLEAVGARDAMNCKTCQRDADRMNSDIHECSHVDCPHRRKAWSERPAPAARRAVAPQPQTTKPVDKEMVR